MPTIHQLVRHGRKRVKKKTASPALRETHRSVECVRGVYLNPEETKFGVTESGACAIDKWDRVTAYIPGLVIICKSMQLS
jgi:small subunit ribosomal protein S12